MSFKLSLYSGINFNTLNSISYVEGLDFLTTESNVTARFEGMVIFATTGNLSFNAQGNDGIRITIDDVQVLNQWGNNTDGNFNFTIAVEKNVPQKWVVEHSNLNASGFVTVTQAGQVVKSIAPVTPPLDLAIILDFTYSLFPIKENIRLQIKYLCDQIANGVTDYRLSLITITQDALVVDVPFTAMNASNVKASVDNAFNNYNSLGATWPEPWDEALNTAVNSLPSTNRPQIGNFKTWRESAKKAVFLATDSYPGGFQSLWPNSTSEALLENVMVSAREKNIRIFTSYIPLTPIFETGTTPLLEAVANFTFGAYRKTARNSSGMVDAIWEFSKETFIAEDGLPFLLTENYFELSTEDDFMIELDINFSIAKAEWLAEYYTNQDFTRLLLERYEGSTINVNTYNSQNQYFNDPLWRGEPYELNGTSVRWKGTIRPLFTEIYTFYTQHDNSMRVEIDGVEKISLGNGSATGVFPNAVYQYSSFTMLLVAGQDYKIVYECVNHPWPTIPNPAIFRAEWQSARQARELIKPVLNLADAPKLKAPVAHPICPDTLIYYGTLEEAKLMGITLSEPKETIQQALEVCCDPIYSQNVPLMSSCGTRKLVYGYNVEAAQHGIVVSGPHPNSNVAGAFCCSNLYRESYGSPPFSIFNIGGDYELVEGDWVIGPTRYPTAIPKDDWGKPEDR